jgi:hypothetical protein
LPVAVAPTVVAREGYYYGHGLSLAARVRAGYGRWETGVDVTEDDFRPIGALDRNGAGAVPGTADRRGRRRLWLGVRPWATLPVRAMVAADQWIREGRMGPAAIGTTELRGSTSLGLIF